MKNTPFYKRVRRMEADIKKAKKLSKDYSLRQIAKVLGKSHSTIGRYIKK